MLPYGRLRYAEPNAVSKAVDYAKFRSRSHRAVIRVYDAPSNMIETHKHTVDFGEPWALAGLTKSRHVLGVMSFYNCGPGSLTPGAHNETLSVAAIRVCNPDRSPVVPDVPRSRALERRVIIFVTESSRNLCYFVA
jgi:hypothetical protein